MNIRKLFITFGIAFMITGCNPMGSDSTTQPLFLAGLSLSPSNSTITASSSQVLVNDSVAITLTTKDQNGNVYIQPGLSVVFSSSGGTGSGSFTPVISNDEGTYTTNFTPTTANTTLTIGASISNQPLTNSLPAITVTQIVGSIVVFANNNQGANVNAALGSPLEVIVKNSSGAPVDGATVTWTASAGGGSVSGCTASTTNSSGIASCTPTLGTTAGTNTFTATTAGLATPATFMATGNFLTTLSSIAWGTAPTLSYTASSSTPMTTFTAKLEDAYGNVITSNSSTTVTVSLSSGAGALAGTTTVTASSGVATFSAVTDTTAGTVTIQAEENTSNNTITQSNVVISAAAANKIAFVTGRQPGNANATQSLGTVEIAVQDSLGNTIIGSSESISVALTSAGGATLSGTLSQTASSGVATFSGLSVNKVGTYTLTATSADYSSIVSSGFTISAGTPASFSFTTVAASPAYESKCIGPYQLTLYDAGGNTATNNSGSSMAVLLTQNGNATFYSNSSCSSSITQTSVATSSSTSAMAAYRAYLMAVLVAQGVAQVSFRARLL
jgi:hypothetical protein